MEEEEDIWDASEYWHRWNIPGIYGIYGRGVRLYANIHSSRSGFLPFPALFFFCLLYIHVEFQIIQIKRFIRICRSNKNHGHGRTDLFASGFSSSSAHAHALHFVPSAKSIQMTHKRRDLLFNLNNIIYAFRSSIHLFIYLIYLPIK